MNGTANKTVFAFKAYICITSIQTLDAEEYHGQTFSIDLGSVEEAIQLKQKIEQENLITSDMVMDAVTGATASIQLPENLLESLNSGNLTSINATAQRLSYLCFYPIPCFRMSIKAIRR